MGSFTRAAELLLMFTRLLHQCSCIDFKGQNIALNRPAWQQPGDFGKSYAQLAVDGNTNADFSNKSCSHTNEQSTEPAYWTVDLGDLYYITGVKIFNRNVLQNRLRQFKIYGYPGNVTLYDDAIQSEPQYNKAVIDVVIDSTRQYRNITIFLPVHGQKTILTLCEVQIIGGCQVPNIVNGSFSSGQDQYSVVSSGTMIQANCSTGYTLGGAMSTLTCTHNYTWDNQVPSCTLITCKPLALENGSYTYDQNSDSNEKYFYGTIATPKCNRGFEIQLGGYRTCQADGYWSEVMDSCIIVKCEHPGILSRGHYTKSNRERYENGSILFNSTIYANCEEGYTLGYAQNNRTCSENGSWTGSSQKCDPVKCDDLHNTHTATYSILNNSEHAYPYYRSIVQWTCINEKSSVTTLGNQTCGENGEWVGIVPPCQKSSTEGPPIGIIAGVSVGAVVAVLVVLAVLIIVRRRRTPREKHKETSAMNLAYVNSKIIETATTSTSESALSGVTDDNTNKTYYDFTTTTKMPENGILVENLADVVLGGNSEYGFEEQFESLPKGLQKAHKVASKEENRPRNRYKNMFSYDENRVKLKARMSSSNDYINASYINGFDQLRSYIATQGPMLNTLDDFWDMIWQAKCGKIVMLTNLIEKEKSKCEQYWPDSGSQKFGDVTVRMIDSEIFSEFVVRSLAIHKENQVERQVTHFHFTSWPDKGVPKYASSLVQFRNKVKHSESAENGPTVVHCSAGVGRTGTYIALDYLTDQAHALGYVAVLDCVRTLRTQRVNLVQTLDQYVFVHHALVETLMLATSALPAAKFPDAYRELLQIDRVTQKQTLTLAFEMLRKMSPVQDEYQYVTAKDIANKKKNRYSNILPVAEYMPTLSGTSQQETDYINAVFLPTYKEKKAFIVTQLPLETTIPDFWRLVYEHDVHTIVMLNHVSQTKKKEIYWPSDNQNVVYGQNEIKHLTTENVGRHHAVRLKLSTLNKTRTIKQFQCGGWKSESAVPDDPSTILLLIELVQTWQQQTGNHPILVHCMNGAERSGLYCVISAVLERMKIEQDVAISQVIEEMRNCREQIISSEVQFQFCHEAVVAFLEQHDTYSNFTA